MVTSDPHTEEMAARAQAQHMAAMRRKAADKRNRDARERIAQAIADTRPRYPSCKCGLRRGMDPTAVRALGAGCTDPQYVCPRLDAVRRMVAGA